jgi:hypothetical protein
MTVLDLEIQALSKAKVEIEAKYLKHQTSCFAQPSDVADVIVKLPFTSRARSRILISPNAFLPLASCGSNPWPLSSTDLIKDSTVVTLAGGARLGPYKIEAG